MLYVTLGMELPSQLKHSAYNVNGKCILLFFKYEVLVGNTYLLYPQSLIL